jgi:2-polyprenyl-3-methyl-5-hydroxy-6-metoxy-1,4-benzoquinol methylase
VREPISILKSTGLIHGEGASCLDVGINEGFYAEKFVDAGYRVHGIDKNPMPKAIPGVTFTQVRLEDFKTDNKFNLIFARRVLHHTGDPLKYAKNLIDFLDPNDGVFAVSFLGLDDPWVISGKSKGVHYMEAYQLLSLHLELFYDGTKHERGKSMSGEFKLWHIHSFIGRVPQ